MIINTMDSALYTILLALCILFQAHHLLSRTVSHAPSTSTLTPESMALRHLRELFTLWWLIATTNQDILPDNQLLPNDLTAGTLFSQIEMTLNRALQNPQQINADCLGTIDRSWKPYRKSYYNTLMLSTCNFYDCASNCYKNNADIAFPSDYDEMQFIMSFAVAQLQDLFLGVYLPREHPESITCEFEGCNDILQLANGSAFQWQWWMKDSFNRRENDPRCYRVVSTGKNAMASAVSTQCFHHQAVLCTTTCPPSGPPILPPPRTLTDYLPDTPPVLPRRSQRLQDPDYNKSLENFLTADSFNHSQYLPWQSEHGYVDPPLEATSSIDPKDLVAYDCTDPLDITSYQMGQQSQSCLIPSQPQQQRNSSYFLLQKSDTIKLSLKQCRVTQTTIPFYCGAWSHQTFAYPFLQIEERIPVSPRECEDLWDTLSYIDPHQRQHILLPNDTTRVYYLEAGASEIIDGSIHCNGGRYDYKGVTYDNMVVAISRNIQLLTQPASVDDEDLVHVLRPDIFLSCPVLEAKCVSQTAGTFIWNTPNPAQSCRYHQIRHVTGITITDQFGVDTFMSTDDSLIRLLIRESTSKCGHVVLSTNYADLFLTADLYASIFETPLPPSEYSAFTYANQQDGFLYGFLTSYIRQEFHAVHYHACQRNLQDKRFNYDTLLAEQHGSTDGDTAQLTNGYFVTVAGEAWYRHRCRKIIVTAISLPDCYSAIPVRLNDDDLRRYRYYHRLSNDSLQLFVEPHSRRITRRGISTDCSSLFPALYQGLNGNWLALHPEVLVVDPPEILAAEALEALHHNDPADFNFDTGGIYTQEDIAQMEARLHAQRAVQDVGYSLGRTAQSKNWISNSASSQSAFRPETLFGPLADLVAFSPIQMLWDALKLWGLFCSTIMGIYYLIHIIHWFINFAERLLVAPVNPQHSVFRHVWATARQSSNAPEPSLPPRSTRSPPPDSAPPAPPTAPHLPPDGQSTTSRRPSQDIKLPEQQPLLAHTSSPRSYQDMRQELKNLSLQPMINSIHNPSHLSDQRPISYADIAHGHPYNRFRPIGGDNQDIYMNMNQTGVRRRTSPKQAQRRRHHDQHYKQPRQLHPVKPPIIPKPAFHRFPDQFPELCSPRIRSRGSTEAIFQMDDFPMIPPATPDLTHPPPGFHSSPSLLDTSPVVTSQSPVPSPSLSVNTKTGQAGSSPGSTPPKATNSMTQQAYDELFNRFDLLLSSIPDMSPVKREQQVIRASLLRDLESTYQDLKLQRAPLKLSHWDDKIAVYQERIHDLITNGYQT